MTAHTRCRITVRLPHRELWLLRCTVLRALGLPQTGEVARAWGRPNVRVTDVRLVEAVVQGEPEELEDAVRHALWWTLAPGHRGLVHPDNSDADALSIETHPEREEAAQPAPLTRIPPQERP